MLRSMLVPETLLSLLSAPRWNARPVGVAEIEIRATAGPGAGGAAALWGEAG